MSYIFEKLNIVGRALLGLYFILPGFMKITDFSGMSEYMAANGMILVPFFLIATIIIQIGGGLALAAGYRTQIVAFILAGLVLVISVVLHDFWTLDEGVKRAHETQNFVKNMAIMAGLLVLTKGMARAKSRSQIS